MSIRKRRWKSPDGRRKHAWVVDYVDDKGKRHLQTFPNKTDAEAFNYRIIRPMMARERIAQIAALPGANGYASQMWALTTHGRLFYIAGGEWCECGLPELR